MARGDEGFPLPVSFCGRGRRLAARGRRSRAGAWQVLADLGQEARTTLHDWCLSEAAGRSPERACALVVAAAREPLWPVLPRRCVPPCEFFQTDSLMAGVLLAAESGVVGDAHARATQTIWNGLFDRQTVRFSSDAPAAVPRVFWGTWSHWWGPVEPLRSKPTRCGRTIWPSGPALDPTVGARGLYPQEVKRFTPPTDFAENGQFCPTLAGATWPIRQSWRCRGWTTQSPPGRSDGCPWQEVTIHRELLPYLRRMHLYLDRMPLLAPAREN